MRIPLILHAAAASPLVPLFAVLARGVSGRPLRWIVLACVVSLAADGLSLYYVLQGRNNHWVSYLFTPLFTAALLLALGGWQRTHREVVFFRLTTGLFLLAAAGIAVFIEDRRDFSQIASPLGSLLVLSTALWTLVRRGLDPRGDGLLRAEWFWAALGLALHAGVTAAYFPLAAAFGQTDPDLQWALLFLKSWLVIVAFCLVGWGVLCRVPAPLSGPSSSSLS